jgi:hypothetical protein
MKMPEPSLSPSEISAMVYDSGHIRDRGDAVRLEQRIATYGTTESSKAHTKGLVTAARAAHKALASIKGVNNRAAAARVVRAIEGLLPPELKGKEGYALGYKDGNEDAIKKTKRDERAPQMR